MVDFDFIIQCSTDLALLQFFVSFLEDCLILNYSKSVQLKKEAAEIFCKKNNLKYLITDCKTISKEEIKKLYDDQIIKFQKKYENLFLSMFK